MSLGRLAVVVTLAVACGKDRHGDFVNTTPPHATIVELALRPGRPIVAVGRRIQLVAQATAADGATYDQNQAVTWSVDAATLCSVNDLGQVQGLSAGTAMVTATHPDGPVATVAVEVIAADVASIAVTPASPTLSVGGIQQLAATAVLLDSSTKDVTASAAWSSNNLAAVTVDAAGMATAVGAGVATVAATFLGIRGTTSLEVR
jgi:uncharacterized protein YjdB